jgi:hypothetical protein
MLLRPYEEARMYFAGKGPVLEAFARLQERLRAAGIPYIFIGATAVNAYGYRRSTEDVVVSMRLPDLERFRRELVGSAYQPVVGRKRRFYDPDAQVSVDIVVSGAIAGDAARQREIRFPDPAEAETVDGIPVPSLARLIELKLVTWRFHDWADVVHLIRINGLNETFADRVHPIVRMAYLQCLDQMNDEERYNPEIDDEPSPT